MSSCACLLPVQPRLHVHGRETCTENRRSGWQKYERNYGTASKESEEERCCIRYTDEVSVKKDETRDKKKVLSVIGDDDAKMKASSIK